MKYKVGDKVKIKSVEWYRSKARFSGGLCPINDINFVSGMAKYLGQTCVIQRVDGRRYSLEGIPYHWADYMLEDPIVEDVESEEIAKPSSDDPYSWLF